MEKISAAICQCGQVILPPKNRCVLCSGITQPIEINNIGKVLTFTILHVTPEGFNPPLILGLIELDLKLGEKSSSAQKQDLKPVKIICIGKIPEDELEIGLKVRIGKVKDKYFFSKLKY